MCMHIRLGRFYKTSTGPFLQIQKCEYIPYMCIFAYAREHTVQYAWACVHMPWTYVPICMSACAYARQHTIQYACVRVHMPVNIQSNKLSWLYLQTKQHRQKVVEVLHPSFSLFLKTKQSLQLFCILELSQHATALRLMESKQRICIRPFFKLLWWHNSGDGGGGGSGMPVMVVVVVAGRWWFWWSGIMAIVVVLVRWHNGKCGGGGVGA